MTGIRFRGLLTSRAGASGIFRFEKVTGCWLLGAASALPVYVTILDDKTFNWLQVGVLAVFLGARITGRDVAIRFGALAGLVALYLSWSALSVLINLSQEIMADGQAHLFPRAASAFALLIYGVLPCLVGALYLRSVQDMEEFLNGFITGALASAVVLIGLYVLTYYVDPTALRQVVGQRTPLLLLFAAVCLLRTTIPRALFFICLTILLFTIFVAETRAIVLVTFAATPLAIAFLWKRHGRLESTALLTLVAGASAWLLASEIALTFQRFSWLAEPPSVASVQELTNSTAAVEYDRLPAREQDLVTALRAVSEPCPDPDPASPCAVQKRAQGEAIYLDYLASFKVGLAARAYQAGRREESMMTRLIIWEELLDRVAGSPTTLLAGFGQLGPAYVGHPVISPHGRLVERYSAHSEYLDQLTRGGIIGLLLFLGLYAAVLGKLLRAALSRGPFADSAAALAIGFVIAAGYGIFHESTRYPQFGIVFWLIVGSLTQPGLWRSDIGSEPPHDLPAR